LFKDKGVDVKKSKPNQDVSNGNIRLVDKSTDDITVKDHNDTHTRKPFRPFAFDKK
jgi:hypothetical protein